MATQGKKTERVVGFDCEFVTPPPDVLQSECPVCLQIIRDPHQVTCCGKRFCDPCIQRVKADKKPCPTCKTEKFSDFRDRGHRQSLYAFKVRCSHQKDGCKWTGELGQLDGHLNTDPQPEKQLSGCQFVEICCIYACGDRFQRRYIQTHQTVHCPKRPFSCEHCHNYESNFDDVTNNHVLVCGSFPLHCPNKCGLELQRQNVDSHVADKCPLTTILCDFLHVGCAVKRLRKDMPEHLRENLLTHISLLATSHAQQQAEIVTLHTVVKENKTRINRLETKNIELHKVNRKLQADLTSLSVVPRTTIPIGLSVLTMTNFKKHKRSKDQWFSPPVYTHHQGYKICLGVYADGTGTGEGTHVSVFVHFIKGEFDESLKWPFRGVISFQLLDQLNGSDHKIYSITYNDTMSDRCCCRVTGKEKGWGWGPIDFIAHTELKPKYLIEDTLLFQVNRVDCN